MADFIASRNAAWKSCPFAGARRPQQLRFTGIADLPGRCQGTADLDRFRDDNKPIGHFSTTR
jgi:hypothetical protein